MPKVSTRPDLTTVIELYPWDRDRLVSLLDPGD